VAPLASFDRAGHFARVAGKAIAMVSGMNVIIDIRRGDVHDRIVYWIGEEIL
jgi:hypothetical protein